jgi:autotransporter-associated beta strand protein
LRARGNLPYAGFGGFALAGGGTLTLSGTSSQTASTTVSGGTLSLLPQVFGLGLFAALATRARWPGRWWR